MVVFSATLLTLLLLASDDDPTNGTPLEDKIPAPIRYEYLMLILSDNQGNVAVVDFPKQIENGTEYRYRCLSKTGNVTTGKGKVFEKYERKPVKGEKNTTLLIDKGSKLFIVAGSITVKWSMAHRLQGWIMYNPDVVSVQIGYSRDFEKIKLERFRKKRNQWEISVDGERNSNQAKTIKTKLFKLLKLDKDDTKLNQLRKKRYNAAVLIYESKIMLNLRGVDRDLSLLDPIERVIQSTLALEIPKRQKVEILKVCSDQIDYLRELVKAKHDARLSDSELTDYISHRLEYLQVDLDIQMLKLKE